MTITETAVQRAVGALRAWLTEFVVVCVDGPVDLPALVRHVAAQLPEPEPVVWLIERPQDGGVQYLALVREGLTWTLSAHGALRFARREDAEAFAAFAEFAYQGPVGGVTDHVFTERPLDEVAADLRSRP